jgi:hypothetical protein
VFIRQITEAYEVKQAELEAVKQMACTEAGSKYVPVRGDLVDEALADWYSSKPQMMPVMFSRLEAELYQFGTKRVGLRLEGAKLVVKIGSSSLSIDKYIELNLSAEVGESRPCYALLKDRDQISPSKAIRYSKLNENSPVTTYARKPTASPKTRF